MGGQLCVAAQAR